MAEEYFFGGASAEERAYVVEQYLRGHYLSFFGQVPCGAESLAARHDGYLHQRVAVAQMPRHGGMACLMDGYGAFLFVGEYFGAFL